jgi:DNA-binding MarR family transcriptional regulator
MRQEIDALEEVAQLLPELSKLIHTAVARDPLTSNLTLAQGRALSFLYHRGEATVSDVAAGLAVTLPSASELIDRLAERGLVERSVDPKDRRRAIIRPSQEAIEFGQRLHELRLAQVRKALDTLPQEDVPMVARALRSLVDTLRESSLNAACRERPEAIPR